MSQALPTDPPPPRTSARSIGSLLSIRVAFYEVRAPSAGDQWRRVTVDSRGAPRANAITGFISLGRKTTRSTLDRSRMPTALSTSDRPPVKRVSETELRLLDSARLSGCLTTTVRKRVSFESFLF